ncbi:hypothetical protein PIB30_032269 [Stylosanthes scabra]|uniref:Uncharacterized protein n=1 Tax=Stylosanthes scabra TaxID=79078 RepID=A0ABU6X9S7_9FABA|nr:hypothetical protein [Stylosanthes scabra]
MTLHSHPLNTSTFGYTTLLPPCFRRASAASPSDSCFPVVPWRCRPFRLRSFCSAAACVIVQFVCARHCSADGRRLSFPHRASSKPLLPIFGGFAFMYMEDELQAFLIWRDLCEELTRKDSNLVLENENLKKEKNMALKEYPSLETTNKHLKAQIYVKFLTFCYVIFRTAEHTKWIGTFQRKQDFIDVVEGLKKEEVQY